MWLNDSIKLFYIYSTSNLLPKTKPKDNSFSCIYYAAKIVDEGDKVHDLIKFRFFDFFLFLTKVHVCFEFEVVIFITINAGPTGVLLHRVTKSFP